MDASTEYPPAINGLLDAEVGNEFTGTLVSYAEAPSKFGADVIIANLRDVAGNLGADEGTYALWLSATVLRSAFARLKPKEGETVAVRYLGQREGANGPYKAYAVDCPDRAPFAPDWGAIEAEEGIEG